MNNLPSSIETYFQEAGFSGTEIIIIKKLVEGDAMTLRDLAFKTGKSTGVLDQAMKKLLKKKIVMREMINGTPKYVLHSLESVSKWLQDDMKQKKNVLELRHQNFESFIASVTSGKKRPEMQFFQGEEGLKKAYMLLLEKGNDFVQYGPTIYTETEDPLRDFRVQYFRERRKRNIFLRVITNNVPLGRRFQNRDPFEYRKTILVDEQSYPFGFEKIIVGNTVACIQHEAKEACFIEYAELAERERQFFERLWNMKLQKPDVEVGQSIAANPLPFMPMQVGVPTKTKILSEVREFFLSRKSIVAFGMCALLAAGFSYFLYQYNLSLYTKVVQEKVKSISTTASLQFNAVDLHELRTPEDITKPQYAKVIYLLNEIRRQNEGVQYAYIMRPTEKDGIWTFVADADSLDPSVKKDLNRDGKIDERDMLSPPGQEYDTRKSPPFENNKDALIQPMTFGPAKDQWGDFISGWAPIKDLDGKAVAILGIDVFTDSANTLTRQSFTPVYYFISFFLLFILLRLAAFNRSLFKELHALIDTRKILVLIGIMILVVISIFYSVNLYKLSILKEQTGKRLMSIAATAASQIDAEDLVNLKFARDMMSEEYQKVFKQLNDIKSKNPDITYAFILRATEQVDLWEFVVDADSNYFIPFLEIDSNKDRKLDEADENVAPGVKYFDDSTLMIQGYNKPTYDKEYVVDQWGESLTGYAPIKDKNGISVAVLCISIFQ